MKKVICILLMSIKLVFCYNISGKVINKETGETIIGVNVIDAKSGLGAATDNAGFFIIRNLKPGEHQLIFSHISFQQLSRTVEVAERDLYLERIELSPKTIENEAIEVFGKRKSIIDEELDVASFEANPEILLNAPQLNKDVFQLMQYSPSVSISDPFSPLFHVRGSDPGENLVQLDGMTIYNPQHFMASEAIFNPYAIKNIEMLVGGFGAEHGGRNASILNILTREGNQNQVQGEFKPSTSGISGAIEFPIKDNSTAMLSCRVKSSIFSYVFMDSPNLMSDLIGKYNTKIGNTRLSLTGFYGQDYQNFDVSAFTMFFPELDSFEEGFIANTKNYALGVKSNSVLLPNLLLNNHVYFSGSSIDNETYFKFEDSDSLKELETELNYSAFIKNRVSDMTFKSNLTYYAFWNQTLKLGFEINSLDFLNQVGEHSIHKETQKTNIQSMFLQDRIELGNFSLKMGLRNSKLHNDNKWRLEPRISAAYKTNITTFKVNWGRYNQYLTTLDNRSDEFVRTLQYFQSLNNYKPVASEKISIGLDSYINSDLSLSLTAYYKDLFRLYNICYNSAGIGAIEKGSGHAYGIEALLRGRYEKLSGWIAYSYSRGFRSYPSYKNGKEYPYDGDQPHNFKAMLLYKLTNDITTSTTIRISSGYPKTWETGKYSQFNYDPINNDIGSYPRDITPMKNNVRYPPRITIDLGWKKKLRSGFGHYLAEYLGADDSYYTVSITNIMFLRRNPYYYIYMGPEFGYYGLDPFMFPMPLAKAGYVIKF